MGNGLDVHVYRERSSSLGEKIKQRNSYLSITRIYLTVMVLITFLVPGIVYIAR